MKKFYRWLCFALVLLMITSCTNGNTSDNGTEAPTEAPTEDVGNLIVKNGRAEYSIVYAQGLPESTLAVVDALQTAILEYTGANIKINGDTAMVTGVEKLYGSTVCAHDLRAGAALVIAGLAAEGTTYVEHIHFVERGYEKLVEKLSALGADIKRVED